MPPRECPTQPSGLPSLANVLHDGILISRACECARIYRKTPGRDRSFPRHWPPPPGLPGSSSKNCATRSALLCAALLSTRCCAQAAQSDSGSACFQLLAPQQYTLPASPLRFIIFTEDDECFEGASVRNGRTSRHGLHIRRQL